MTEITQRKRGRPKGSKNKPKLQQQTLSSVAAPISLHHEAHAAPTPLEDNRWFPTQKARDKAKEALEKEYKRQIDQSIDRIGGAGENHSTAISVARTIMLRIIEGDPRIIVIAPTLSGKTSIMKSLAKMQRAIINVNQLFYHCGVNYLENRRQAAERLAVERISICSLKERRRAEEISTPCITLYDETQICQRPDQTLAKAFKKSKTFHKIGSVTVAFSATPNSVLAGNMFTQIWVPIDEWIRAGYCDLKYLIDSGRLLDADPIFLPVREPRKKNGKIIDWMINVNANALGHLLKILSKPKIRNGYSLIRLPKRNAQRAAAALIQYVQTKGLSSHVNYIFYTEENPHLGPSLFKNNVTDQHCVVFLKNKLSVGVDLDTRWIKLFYENSPNATVESFAQAAAGRVPGWGKKSHECIVYTSLKHAEVYAEFLHRRWDAYLQAAKDAGLKISTGAKIISEASREVVDIATYHFPETVGLETLKRLVKERILTEHGLHVDTTRTLSATKFDYGHKKNPIWTPDQPAKDFKPSNQAGTVTLNILNRYHPSLGRQKDWVGSIVRAIRTTDNIIEVSRAEPHKTIHSPEHFM